MENLELFQRSLKSSPRRDDTNQIIKEESIKLEGAISELSHASTALACLMDIVDDDNCKSWLVFLDEARASTIPAYNTINTANNELINKDGYQKHSNSNCY